MEKKKIFVIKFLYYGIIIGLLFLAYKYALPYVIPFVFGFLLATICDKPIKYLSEKKHFPRTIVSIVILLIIYLIVIGILILLGAKLINFLIDFFTRLPEIYDGVILPFATNVFNSINDLIESLDPSIVSVIENNYMTVLNKAGSVVSSLSSRLIGSLTGYIGGSAMFVIRLVLTIISSFYFAIDYQNVITFFRKQLSIKVLEAIDEAYSYFKKSLVLWIKSYGLIMFITFLELTLGFFILGIKNVLLYAAIIAVIDIVPVLGVGTILIPWLIIEFINHNYLIAIGLLIMQIVIYFIRQIIEPKIVGDNLELHPIVSLASMFAATQIIGGAGLFVGPILATIIIHLNKEGYIKIFK